MALNLTGLPDFIKQSDRSFITEAVLGSQTVAILQAAGAVQFGIKGKAAINTLAIDVNFQDGSDCGRNPVGSTSISQQTIEVTQLKDEQNYCPKKYEDKYTGEFLTKGQTYNELLFAQDIMGARAAKIAETNEKAIWQASTTLTGNTNLNKFDGFVKQIKAGAAVSVTASGSTIIEKLQDLVDKSPIVTTVNPDARLFIGTDVYQRYVAALAKEKLYVQPGDKVLWGTTMKMEVVDGLIATSFALVAKPQHLVYGTDLIGEEDAAIIEYSMESKQIYMDFHWAMGVKPVQTSEMAYSTVA